MQNLSLGTFAGRQRTPVIGAELVSNGTFAGSSAGWTANGLATLTTPGGELLVTLGATSSSAYQDVTVIAGQTYIISGTARVIAGSSAAMEAYGAASFASLLWTQITASGTNVTLSGSLIATGTVIRINLVGNGAITNASAFDNISLKNVSG